MLKILPQLLLLICLSTHTISLAFSLFDLTDSPTTHDLPLTNAYIARNGINRIFKGPSGYYVGADLRNDRYIDTSDSDFGPDTVPMQLALYTNETWLATSCLSYSSYNCSDHPCEPYPEQRSQSLLTFNASGETIAPVVNMDYNNWLLTREAGLASSCETSSGDLQSSGMYGVIGLGRSGNAQYNFIGWYHVFSINVYQNLSGGQLVFGERNYAGFDVTTTAVLETDPDWVADCGSSCIITIGYYTASVRNAKVIFDLDANSIGLPLASYYQVMHYLVEYLNMKCDDKIYLPVCTYTGSYESLPSIFLMVNGQSITIPPLLYVQDYSLGSGDVSAQITLNLKGVASNLTGSNYVTEPYQNYIILDDRFMSYYTVYFNTSGLNHRITVIYAKPIVVPPATDPLMPWVLILLGFAVVTLLSALCCYCRGYEPKQQARLMSISESINQTSGLPQDLSVRGNRNLTVHSVQHFQARRDTGSTR